MSPVNLFDILGMISPSLIIDYGEMPPARRRWRAVWRGILIVFGIVSLLLISGWIFEHSGHRRYADLNSGDVMTQHYFAGVRYRTTIEPTPFSKALRRYFGPTPPANWVFADGKMGPTFEDGVAGGSLSECNEIILATTMVSLTEDEMKALLKRCSTYLANDQRKDLYDEVMKLGDRMSATQP